MKLRLWQAAFLALIISLLSCTGDKGSSGDEGSSGANTSLKVLASNVVFSSTAQAGEVARLDTETKVLAENVVIDKAATSLSSENLQDALENELAPSAADILVGTWTCKDSDGVETGTITLDGTSFNLVSGTCLRFGDRRSEGFGCATALSYKVIASTFIQVAGNTNDVDCGNKNARSTGSFTYHITKITPNEIVLFFDGQTIYFLEKTD